MSKLPVSFILNGAHVHLEVEPNTTLLQALRDQAFATDVKYGCGEGVCGTCTVLLDGETVNSCLTLTVQADGCEITTVTGLVGSEGEMHPVQSAFLACGASQCGFCTPGMVLTACEFLGEHKNPTREEIRLALEGNLCRCTGYTQILDAVERASRTMAEETKHGVR
jgi:carbon-monoxide dehydrogenase small subunit